MSARGASGIVAVRHLVAVGDGVDGKMPFTFKRAEEKLIMKLGIINTDDIAPVVYDWGAVKWLVDDDVAAGSEQSFGLVHIHPGQTNPTHWHTAAQEIVYMLQGECDVETDGKTIKLRPGQTLVIPVDANHELKNNGWEPAVYVCSFSASGRGTLFADPSGAGAAPLALTGY